MRILKATPRISCDLPDDISEGVVVFREGMTAERMRVAVAEMMMALGVSYPMAHWMADKMVERGQSEEEEQQRRMAGL